MQQNFENRLIGYAKLLNFLKDFAPCTVCHVYASMLASSGEVDMYTLQKRNNPKSPQMTQRYAHLRDDVMKRAADLAGKIITEAAKTKTEEQVNKGESNER